VSGLLAYVFFALVTRALGATDAAPVAVLWAWWGFAGAGLTFPLQHWISRSVPAHDGERSVREALPGVLLVSVGVALLAGGASWLARDLLFHSDRVWFPVLVGAVTLGSAVMGIVRGVLTARRRFRAVGAGLVAENAVRCLAAAALIAAGVRDPVAFGLCLLAGYVAVLGWPSSLRLGSSGAPRGDESALTFLGGAAGGQLIGQAVLTGGPVVLALAGGSARDITALFAGLALFRAPYTLAVGLVSQLTGRFTRLVVQRRDDALRRIRLRLVGLTVVGGAAAALVGALAGPPLLRLVFGADVTLPSRLTLVLAVGSTVAMANLVVTLVVLAHGRTPALIRAWALALVPGVIWFLAADLPALDRTCWAFLVVETAAFGLLLREEARGTAGLR
jgi:O-antigen/teichoic acid export membrane protein